MTMQDRRRIEALLDDELALAESLASTLDTERAALTGTEPDLVAEQAAAKLGLLSRLEELERSRRDLCRDVDMTLVEGIAAAGARCSG